MRYQAALRPDWCEPLEKQDFLCKSQFSPCGERSGNNGMLCYRPVPKFTQKTPRLFYSCSRSAELANKLHQKFGFDIQAFLETPVSSSYDHGEVTHLYLMQSGQFHKVGIAANVQKRLTSIQAHSGHPVKVERTIPYESRLWALIAERTVHGMLAKWRIHGEWFDIDRKTAGEAITIIKAEMPRLIHRHKMIAQQKRDAMQERYETDPEYRAEIDAERKRVNDTWERTKAEMLGS